jgi:pectate lyase
MQVSNYGKLVRSCGECKQQCQRNIVVDTILASGQSVTLVGVNENYGDKATIKNVQGLASSAAVCTEYTGVGSGSSSTKLRDFKVGSTGDGKNCVISGVSGRKK